jgi:hypothetical protein
LASYYFGAKGDNPGLSDPGTDSQPYSEDLDGEPIGEDWHNMMDVKLAREVKRSHEGDDLAAGSGHLPLPG